MSIDAVNVGSLVDPSAEKVEVNGRRRIHFETLRLIFGALIIRIEITRETTFEAGKKPARKVLVHSRPL